MTHTAAALIVSFALTLSILACYTSYKHSAFKTAVFNAMLIGVNLTNLLHILFK